MEQDQLKEKITEKLVVVLLITLFTIILWGGFQIITSLTKERPDPKVDQYIKAIPSTYDKAVIEELKQRQDEGSPTTTTDTTETTDE